MTRSDVAGIAPATGTRVVGVDATRGLALLGMMAVHALWAFDAEGDVTWTYSVAAGRSAATFAVLAGVGIAFITRRRRMRAPDVREVAAYLTTRAAVIGAIGLSLGYADPDVTAVILTYYAVLFVLAIPLTFLSTRTVLTTGLVVALVMPVVSHAVRSGLPGPSGLNPSWGRLVEDPGGLILELTLTGMYPALPWTAYVCVGLAIGRSELASSRVASRLLGAGVLTAVAASAVSWLALGPLGGRDQLDASASASGMSIDEITNAEIWGHSGTTPPSTWWWLASDAPHGTTPLDLLHTAGVAVALLGAFLLLSHVGTARIKLVITAVLAPLAAAGSMTLTLYTAHVVFMNSPLDVFPATTGYLIQVVVALLFALIWRRTVGRGPLELVVTRAAAGARGLLTPPPARVLPHPSRGAGTGQGSRTGSHPFGGPSPE